MKMTGGRALAEQLIIEGIDTIFGVPGYQLDPAVDALYELQDKLRFIQTRHEQGAAYLADGYARASGTVGAFMVVPGPGMLNTTAALSTAYACSSPVLAIIGQIPSHRIGAGRGMLHEIREQSHIIATLTKWCAIAHQPEEIPGLVHQAFQQLRSGRPQPVALEIPPDVLSATGDIDLVETAAAAEPLMPEADVVSAAAKLLDEAQRPLICVGWGVSAAGGEAALKTLAETLHAPVVASLTGQGSLSSEHPLAFDYTARGSLLAEADVVLAVGTRFLDGLGEPVKIPDGARLIAINADEHDLAVAEPSVAVHGDARIAMDELSGRITGAHRAGWPDAVLASVRERDERRRTYLQPQLSWISALRAAIPADGVLVNELTQVGYVAQLCYPTLAPRTFLTPGYQGTLGYGFATALGSKAALPDRVVVSITGDGGFGWNLQELSTARKYDIGLITVVFRDDQFGNVHAIQEEQYGGRFLGTDLCNPDFVKLAEAFGVRGVTAKTPEQLATEIRAAIASGEPTVIDVPVDAMPSPWHLIHDWWPIQPPEA